MSAQAKKRVATIGFAVSGEEKAGWETWPNQFMNYTAV